MRNVLLGTIAILISSSIVMARPVQKSNMSLKSLVEFKINQKNNLKLSPLNEDDDENHNLPPIRTGKVKYTISKGTFGNTAEGWDYTWSPVCEMERNFEVHVANSSWDYEEPSLIECQTTLDGKAETINAVILSVEGNDVVLDSGEPSRSLSAYVLYSYVGNPLDDFFKKPSLPMQILASEKRPTSQFVMMSRPPTEVTCVLDQAPGEGQDPVDGINCTAKWKEIFRVTAVVED